jgi:hypothetical protein
VTDEETLNPKQGPGGDVERVAAKLVYDSAFAVMVHNRGTQDSEIVREVLERERERGRGGGREWSLGAIMFYICFPLTLLLHYYYYIGD